MRVGILMDKFNPNAGGAATLSDTILEDIKNSNIGYEFFILFYGDRGEEYRKTEDGIVYINLNNIKRWNRFRSKVLKLCELVSSTIHNRIRDLGVGTLLDEILKNEQIDILWFTFPAVLPITIPYIYTIWDLSNRQLPGFPEVNTTWADWEYRESLCVRMAYRAVFVITGNESGKREILENYPMSPAKIRIAPFPVSTFCDMVEEKPGFPLPDSYFFYPAQFWAHKNHICILQAIKKLKEVGACANVIFVGSDKGNKEYIKKMSKKYDIEEQVIFAGFVSYPALKFLYTHAEAMIYASLLGPNNLPPVEAAYLGCPVIITDISGHKEQMKDAALYFNAFNPEELAERMQQVLDEGVREALLKKTSQLKEELHGYSYTENVLPLLKEFEEIRLRWNDD